MGKPNVHILTISRCKLEYVKNVFVGSNVKIINFSKNRIKKCDYMEMNRVDLSNNLLSEIDIKCYTLNISRNLFTKFPKEIKVLNLNISNNGLFIYSK